MRSARLTIVILLAACCIAAAGPIHDAAEQGDLEQVKSLLDGDPQLLESKAVDGKTALHKAAYVGQTDVVKYLLEKGADPAARSNQNSTPAHGAAYYGHEDAIALLIEYGTPVDAANDYGYVPLLSACAAGHTSIVKRLIAAGADPNAKTNQGANALLNAAASGNAEMFDLLIDSGTETNLVDNDGENLLHYAAWGGNVDLMKRAIADGIDIASVSSLGVTALHNAAGACRLNAIEFLLQNGVDVNTVDNEGETCLIRAVQAGFGGEQPDLLPAIDALISNGADVNLGIEGGPTPLIVSIWTGNLDLIAKLLEAGAEPNVSMENGNSPINASIQTENMDLLRLLAEHGAKADLPRKLDGLSSLHLAAVGGNLEIVESLLEGVEDMNVKDDLGLTPLDYANKYGNKQVADLLRSNGALAVNSNEDAAPVPYQFESLTDKEAYLWYLGHCGWAIQTKDHFLVFDYWSRGVNPSDPCMANGHINPEEIADLNVEVFVSHDHTDHYDSVIFDWESRAKNLTYVFGFKPEDLPEGGRMGYSGQSYEYFAPRSQRTLDGMTVHTIESNDGGVGFLVEVDGLRIYHAGDHAGWTDWDTGPGTFKKEIDYLANVVGEVDFAFVNVTGCRHRDTLALDSSVVYTIRKLSPKIFIPTHGLNSEQVYQKFSDRLTERDIPVKSICARFRGDRYHYKEEQIL